MRAVILLHVLLPALFVVTAEVVLPAVESNPIPPTAESRFVQPTSYEDMQSRATVEGHPEDTLTYAASGKAFVVRTRDGRAPLASELHTTRPVYEVFGLREGRWLLYRPLKSGVPTGDLVVENLETRKLEKITSDLVLQAAFSPTNRDLVGYIYVGDDAFGLATVDLASGEIRRLIQSGVYAPVLQWHPSGKGLFYYEVSGEEHPQVASDDGRAASHSPGPSMLAKYLPLDTQTARAVSRAELPAGYPWLQVKAEAAVRSSDGPCTGGGASVRFYLSLQDGRFEVRGREFSSATSIEIEDHESGHIVTLANSLFLAGTPWGVLTRRPAQRESQYEWTSWDGVTTTLPGTVTVVDYYLPMESFVVTQGGANYSPPGDCPAPEADGGHWDSNVGMGWAYDMASVSGAHVLASAPGMVVKAVGWVQCNSGDPDCVHPEGCSLEQSFGGWGNTVIIEHADGRFSKYCHMQTDSVQVTEGETVCRGLYLGNQGHTGFTYSNSAGCGDHLHFQRQLTEHRSGQSIEVDFVETADPLSCFSPSYSGGPEVAACDEPCYELPPVPVQVNLGPVADDICQGFFQKFSFPVSSGRQYRVALIPDDGNTDLYVAASEEVSPDEYDYPPSTNPGTAVDEVVFIPMASGTYHAAVEGIDQGTSTYAIEVWDIAPSCFGSIEPLQVNAPPVGNQTICQSSWQKYSFPVTAGRSYRINLNPTTGNSDLYVAPDSAVSPAAGGHDDQSANTGLTDDVVEITPSSSGTFYAAVHGVDAGVNEFEIDVDDIAPACYQTTVPVSVTDAPQADTICQSSWQRFSFPVEAGRQYEVILDPSNGDTDLYLGPSASITPFLPNYAYTQPLAGTSTETISFVAEATGTYYAAVHGVSAGTSSFTIDIASHRLNVFKSGSGTGYVSSSSAGIDCGADCTEVYLKGTGVNLSAVGLSGSVFAGWSGDADCADDHVVMDGDRSCTANFDQAAHTLTVNKSGPGTGTVVSQPAGILCGPDCSQTFDDDTVVLLQPFPSINSTFTGWGGDPDCEDGEVTMVTDLTCTAIFGLAYRTLTVSKQGSGTGTVTSSPSGIDCGNDCSESFAYGTPVWLTPTPSAGSVFGGWSGDPDCDDNHVVVDSDKVCVATFERAASVLLVDDDDNTPDVRAYYADTLTALGVVYDVWDTGNSDDEPTLASLAGYDAVVWFTGDEYGESGEVGAAGPGPAGESGLGQYLDGGGCLMVSSQSYLFDRGVTSFMSGYLGVGAAINDAVHVNVSGAGPAFEDLGPYGLVYPGIPNYSDGVYPSSLASTIFRGNGDAAIARDSGIYRAMFFGFPFEALPDATARGEVLQRVLDYCESPPLPRLTVQKLGGGSGTVTSDPAGIDCGADCEESYALGSIVMLEQAVAPGSGFGGWGGDVDCLDGRVAMNSDRDCTATFHRLCSVTTAAEPAVAGQTDGDGTFICGAQVTVSAEPNQGYAFVDWREGGMPASSSLSYTFVLDTDRVLVAHFEEEAQCGNGVCDPGEACPLDGSGPDVCHDGVDNDCDGVVDNDQDGDGLGDTCDPCPDQRLNECFGPVAIDGQTGFDLRLNTHAASVAYCAGSRVDCRGKRWLSDFGAPEYPTGYNQEDGFEACFLGPNESCPVDATVVFGCTDAATANVAQCGHWDRPEDPELIYFFDVPDGDHVVNLLFMNSFSGSTQVGDRIFDVRINGVIPPQLDDFDQVAAAGGPCDPFAAPCVPTSRSVTVTTTGGGGLTIEFLSNIQRPSVKGIEVLCNFDDAAIWYADVDGDGLGAAGTGRLACIQPGGYVGNDSDCDDSESGCGFDCADSDGDGTPDCLDGCPNDPGKTDPGVCDCGVSDADSDGDGTPDCLDGCPNDPDKIDPGVCDCGTADIDSDGDGTFDCDDLCPNDPGKVEPGVCDCGAADADSDGDGTFDCDDLCPNDPGKTDPGVCDCGTADIDSDGDGTLDCDDLCPNDPGKIDPGVCDCGTADIDSDGDGPLDCEDGCPNDPDKVDPGVCDCGSPDDDTDGDGTADCVDACPLDAPDDADADGVCTSTDNCPDVANPSQGPVVVATILAISPATFAWAEPVDVRWVVGPIARVHEYFVVDPASDLATATSFTHTPSPPAGTGFFYLVRPGCPAGSWQTEPGQQPDRDLSLP